MNYMNNKNYFQIILIPFFILVFFGPLLAENEPLQVLNDTAISLYEQGKYVEAEELAQRALRHAEDTMGTDNPQIAPFLNNLAVIYYAQKKYSDAAAMYERALSITEQAFGSGHPRVKSLLEAIERCNKELQEQGEPEEAGEVYEVDGSEALSDESPPDHTMKEQPSQDVGSPRKEAGIITNAYFAKRYTVQVGAFKELPRARALQAKLEKNGYDVSLTTVQKENGETFHRVQTGEFTERKKAELLGQEIRELMGLDTFITRK